MTVERKFSVGTTDNMRNVARKANMGLCKESRQSLLLAMADIDPPLSMLLNCLHNIQQKLRTPGCTAPYVALRIHPDCSGRVITWTTDQKPEEATSLGHISGPACNVVKQLENIHHLTKPPLERDIETLREALQAAGDEALEALKRLAMAAK